MQQLESLSCYSIAANKNVLKDIDNTKRGESDESDEWCSTEWPKKVKATTKWSKTRIKSDKSPSVRLDLFVKLKYESSTIILFVGIRYFMSDLLSDLNN